MVNPADHEKRRVDPSFLAERGTDGSRGFQAPECLVNLIPSRSDARVWPFGVPEGDKLLVAVGEAQRYTVRSAPDREAVQHNLTQSIITSHLEQIFRFEYYAGVRQKPDQFLFKTFLFYDAQPGSLHILSGHPSRRGNA